MNEQTLFAEALERTDPRDRAAFLDQACHGDPALRARVERLLAQHEHAGDFLESPAPALSPTVDDPGAEKPGTVIGPYKLLEQIGEGGMGTVYMAEQTAPVRRMVALKIIKPGMDSAQIIARFEAERQALALMDHPNIARVLDAGTTGSGRPYFVMELVKGVPITRFCDEHQLTPRERLELFIPVCQAVQHAHAKGVIHRDLKPSNVLVALYDDKPVPKVIDFGVAKATGEKLTERTLFTGFGSFIGTLEYMSPEQAKMNALDIDTRSDVYSLGVLLYELLTGSTPLEHERLKQGALDELLRIIREEEPPKPSMRLSQTWSAERGARMKMGDQRAALRSVRFQEVDWIVMKALEKDRARRYEMASGLARDILRYLADEPVESHPPKAGYRLRKFARKNKTLLATAAAFTVLLLVGIVTSTLLAVQATRAEARASAALAFLEDHVLKAARPAGQGLGRDITLRQAVDAAEPKIADAFRGQPLVEASIRDVLGETYLCVGEPNLAIRQFDQVVQIRQAQLGPDRAATLTAMNNLAQGYFLAYRFADATALHEQVLAKRRELLGPHHDATLLSMHNLAGVYGFCSGWSKALPLLEETVNIWKARLGPDHPNTLSTMFYLADGYMETGRLAEAQAMGEELVKRAKSTLGPDNDLTLHAMDLLALIYPRSGRLDDAIPLLKEAIERSKAVLGPDHLSTLKSMRHLGELYHAAGQNAEAITLLEETVKLATARLGPGHQETLTPMNVLGGSYHAAGRNADALACLEETVRLMKKYGHYSIYRATESPMIELANLYFEAGRYTDGLVVQEEVVKLRQDQLGADDLNTLDARFAVAKSHQELGHSELAESIFADIVRLGKPKLGADHELVCFALCRLGRNLLKQSKYAEAESPLHEGLAIYQKKLPDDWGYFDTQSHLGGSLLGQKKYAEAEPLLLAGQHGLESRKNMIPADAKVRLTEAVERLVQLYDSWEKPEKAGEWRKKLEASPKEEKKP